ncbi:MAG: ribonuclease J [Nitrospirae bacterium]|nr:MAG: ribonuclease J [Nitrospirota bacterium]
MDERLDIIALGGLEEIGLNCTVFRYGDALLVVDAGLMFPEEDMPGVDFVIPDFSYLIDNRQSIKALILTHGHEDHTGAVPFLLKELSVQVPIYGTALTLGLLRQKLIEHGIQADLKVVKPRDSVNIGPFEVEFIRVTHSIVDGVGLAINTPVGTVVHTGDFKLDPTPVDGELIDFNRFSHYGDRGTLLLLSDSTNAERGGFTYSEKEVRRALENIFSTAPGRIIIATFSSNIHRIQQIIDVSLKYGRRVSLCGKSLIANAKIALELGYLKMPEGTWLRLSDIMSLPDNQIVLVTTGSQGEPMSVLSRIAMDEHKEIKIKPDDTVVLSAKMIPGNERAIGKIINHLFRRGANVIYEKVSEVHVSGHASKEELKLMLNLIRPRFFMPVHGEYRHLCYHAMLARKQGIPDENIFLLQNGDVLTIDNTGARVTGQVQAGRVFIDGKGGIEDMVLRDRRRLAHDGILLILLGMEKPGKVFTGPDIISKGFVLEESSSEILEEIKSMIIELLGKLEPEALEDSSILKAKLRSSIKKFILKRMNRRPMILPIIFEI